MIKIFLSLLILVPSALSAQGFGGAPGGFQINIPQAISDSEVILEVAIATAAIQSALDSHTGDVDAHIDHADSLAELNAQIGANIADGPHTAGDFANGGEAGGANRSLGNTDAFSLSFLTSNLARIVLSAAGNITLGLIEVRTSGGLRLYSRTISQLQAIVPEAEGEQFYCSDCSPKKVVISTGTSAGNFAGTDGGDFR